MTTLQPQKAVMKSLIMLWRRQRLGLSQVHRTFYVAKDAAVCKDLVAGPYSFVNGGCLIGPRVILGAYVMIGPRVMIVGADHVFDIPGRPTIFSGRPNDIPATRVGDDAWIGAGTIIMAGRTIGIGAIVAAGSVVVHDVPDLSIFGGNPARLIRRRFASTKDDETHLSNIAARTITHGGHYIPPL